MRIVTFLFALTVASAAYANGGDHTCQGGHNCNEGGGTVNKSESVSSSSSSVVNSVPVTVNVETPEGGFTPQAIDGDVEVNVEGDNFEAADLSEGIATPGTLFTNLCTSGAAGSAPGWTASVGSGSRFCKHVKLAETALATGDKKAYKYHMAQAEGLLFRNSFICKWFLLDFIPVVNFVVCP